MVWKRRLLKLLAVLGLTTLGLVPAAYANYYAGYYYCDYACAYSSYGPYQGGYSYENTVNPYVPYFDHFSEWNSVILSYVPLSWVQTGYAKYGGLTGYPTSQTYYCEYNDGNGHNNLHFFSSGPSAGSNYGYTTTGYPPLWTWVCTDGAGETYTYWPGNPAVDAQAFAETTNTCIVIDGTHFNYLQYNNGNSWYLWDRYSAGGTTPYSVSVVSSSQFYASGGTGSC